MLNKCVVSACQRTDGDLFLSPNESVKLNKWKTLLDVRENQFFVCSLHFEDRYMKTRRILMAEAYPMDMQTASSATCCGCCLRGINFRELKVKVDESLRENIRNLVELEVSWTGENCGNESNCLFSFQILVTSALTAKKISQNSQSSNEKLQTNIESS